MRRSAWPGPGGSQPAGPLEFVRGKDHAGTSYPGHEPHRILGVLRESGGYYLCNNERDVSQSDFKNRLMPMTTVRVAPYREAAGFFSVEVSGGASVHVDLMRKQVNPFERLRITRKAMPRTLLQTVCRGSSLFGYRHYPENVIRLTVKEFARYVDVWRVYDFLNHVPNLIPVFEEVQKAERLLMPSICFSTGPEHADRYYVGKVKEILTVTGPDVIISIKNYAGLGTPKRISQLVESICAAFPGLVVHYHGCNTDGNDIGRMSAAVRAGVKIVDVADHGYGAIYGQAPALTLIQALDDYGKKAVGWTSRRSSSLRISCARSGRSMSPSRAPFGGTTPPWRPTSSPAGRWAAPLSRRTRAVSWTACRKSSRKWPGCRRSWGTGGR